MAEDSNRRLNILGGLVPVALATLFFYPVILQGKTFYAFDILFHFIPWTSPDPLFKAHNTLISDPIHLFYLYWSHLKTWIEQGVFPLWNGSNFCGIPFYPGGHPIQFVCYLFLPVLTAHHFLLWLHLAGTGVVMYLYLREIGLRLPSAWIGSVAWMFNGYGMVWFEFEHVTMMSCYFPLTLYLIERWLKQGGKGVYLCLVAVISLTICVNYLHLLIYQFLLVGCYCLYRTLGLRGKHPSFRSVLQRLFWLFLPYPIALIISANSVVAHLTSWEGSIRTALAAETLFRKLGSLPGTYLLTLLFPDLFGGPVYPVNFIPGTETQTYANYNELCIYVGILSLSLLLLSLVHLRRRFVAFFFLAGLASLTMSMGSLLYYPLAEFIPGLNLSTPTRVLYIFGFSAAVLSGLGADILLSLPEGKRLSAIVLAGLPLLAGVCLAVFLQTGPGLDWMLAATGKDPSDSLRLLLKAHLHPTSPVLLKPVVLLAVTFYLLAAAVCVRAERTKKLFLGFLVILLSYDLMSFGLTYNSATPPDMAFPETGAIRLLKADRSLFRVVSYGKFMDNTFSPFGIQDVGGYTSFYPQRYGDFLHLSQYGLEVPLPESHSRWIRFQTFGSPLLDLLNTKYILTGPRVKVFHGNLELIYSDEMNVFYNKAHFPRMFFVPTYAYCRDRSAAFQSLGRMSPEDLRSTVVLESLPPEGFRRDEGTPPGEGRSDIRILTYQPNRIEVVVSTPESGFLVIGDSFHPGWTAEVDGRASTVYLANYVMRAVAVPEGVHRIGLTFVPKALIAGTLITAAGWAAIAFLLGIVAFRRFSRAEGADRHRKTG